MTVKGHFQLLDLKARKLYSFSFLLFSVNDHSLSLAFLLGRKWLDVFTVQPDPFGLGQKAATDSS